MPQPSALRLGLFLLLAGGVCPAATVVAPAAREVSGSLSGRIVFMAGGHGWVKSGNNWILQRSATNNMVEDYGNLDQISFFADYCFNAGATVVPLRPTGHQTNEVVLDNLHAAVVSTGSWSNNTSEAVYYGVVGSGFRQTPASVTETATTTFTPNLPVTGFYPVYTWVPHGANRTNQLYKILHTGGETTVRIPHHMVGNGWVYLGSYYFNAGSNAANGAVVISNLQPGAAPDTVVIADAIRFGNGMGTSGSGYPREEEGARWWIQNSLGQGQSTNIYLSPNFMAPDEDRQSRPKMIREMNREQAGAATKRLYLTFHSNAFQNGAARGTVGIFNNVSPTNNPTPHQFDLALYVGREVTTNLIGRNAELEYPWTNRGSGITLAGSFFEIDDGHLGGEMDATIGEIAFHDNGMDAALLRDPKARNWIARASYRAVVRYMNQFDGAALTFLPDPPTNVRATGGTNGITVAWSLPPTGFGNATPTGFVVYRSTNGYGFGNPVLTNSGTATTVTLANLPAGQDFYFRVAAFNAGGESFPSETVGCRRPATAGETKVLFVNGYDRFDRTTNLRQPITAQTYRPPGNTGTIERVWPRANNSFDYVVAHGQAISAYGLAFDSCSREAVTNSQITLTNYPVVLWGAGQELTNFNAVAQTKLTAFLTNYGNLFLSGAGVALSLDQTTGPSAADRTFFNGRLHADLATDANTNSGVYTFNPALDGIFQGRTGGDFDDGMKGIYWVKSPEVLTPSGAGARAALYYGAGTNQPAAIQDDGSAGSGRVVYFGFPFETVPNAALRAAYLTNILNFLGGPRVLTAPTNASVRWGTNLILTTAVSGIGPLFCQWYFNHAPLTGATNAALVLSNLTTAASGQYVLVLSNRAGTVTATNLTLAVTLPAAARFSLQWAGSNALNLAVTGETGFRYVVETSPDLLTWEMLTAITLTNGPSFGFSTAPTNTQQFYRARWSAE